MPARPSAREDADRYRDRPLLIVLESYVLECIGELAPAKQQAARALVQGVFGGGDDWRATMRQQLQLSAAFDEQIGSEWLRRRTRARESGQDLPPMRFARWIVDRHFAELLQ